MLDFLPHKVENHSSNVNLDNVNGFPIQRTNNVARVELKEKLDVHYSPKGNKVIHTGKWIPVEYNLPVFRPGIALLVDPEVEAALTNRHDLLVH